jgi:hypothetical protein
MVVLRFIKNVLVVMFFGGMIGPIFAGVYLGTSPDTRPYISWMYPTGIAITVVSVLIALLLTIANGKSAARKTALERDGVLALARVIGVTETGTTINDHPLVRLTLHVTGPGFDFTTQDRALMTVDRQASINARQVVVLTDPATKDVDIDWRRSDLVNGLVPARFTSTEDGQTYDLTGQAEPLMQILRILKARGVPFDRPVDARDDTQLRAELQAVLRGAATAAPAPSYGAPTLTKTPPSTKTSVERLQELDALRAAGVISEPEYAAKRDQIIADI